VGADEAATFGVTVDADGREKSAATSTEAQEEDFAVGEEEDHACDEPYC
jgi:hypothetical protein